MDLKYRLTRAALKDIRHSIKKIFVYRVCGTGMGAAAVLLQEKGFQVEGGDVKFYPPMGDYLKKTGIPLHQLKDCTKEFLQKFDLIVVGNVVGGTSPDARMIESLGVPFISFPEVLGALVLADTNVVGIAGTHGKTTTTYLFTQVFENLNLDPGYLIGGVMEERPSSKLGNGKYFFIESDEYDSAYFEKVSKLRHYEIDHLVLTSLEFDHADIFKDVEAIKDQFRAAIPYIKGSFIACQDYPAIEQLFSEKNLFTPNVPCFFYGDLSGNGPFLKKLDEKGSVFSLKLNGKEQEFKTNLIGKHNILNLSTVIFFAFSQGIPLEQIRKAISQLKMVKRRQEFRGTYKEALVIDDFAHHPRAVELTIDAIKVQFPNKRLVTIIEPNSATARSRIFQDEFPISLLKSDKIILAKPMSSTTVKEVGDLDCFQMAKELNRKNRPTEVVVDLNSLQSLIDQEANAETLLLILSNGTCLGLWESSFVQQLKK